MHVPVADVDEVADLCELRWHCWVSPILVVARLARERSGVGRPPTRERYRVSELHITKVRPLAETHSVVGIGSIGPHANTTEEDGAVIANIAQKRDL